MSVSQNTVNKLYSGLGDVDAGNEIITATNKSDAIASGSTSTTFALFSGTPVAQRDAYTQTYSADRTHADVTAATLTDSTGETPSTTISDISTAVTGVDGTGNNAASKTDVDTRLAAINQNLSNLADQINKLVADQLVIKKVLNSVIDDLQSMNWVG